MNELSKHEQWIDCGEIILKWKKKEQHKQYAK